MPVVTNKQLPTPAALNELALLQARTPRTGFSVPKHRPPALTFDTQSKAKPDSGFIDTALLCEHIKVCPHRPLWIALARTAFSRATQLDRTPVLLRDIPCPSKERSKAARDYSDEPPLNWTSHSHGIQLEGSAPHQIDARRLATFGPYPRLMRSRFPDLLSLSGEISSNRSYPRLEYRSSSECVCLSVTTGRFPCLRHPA